MKLARGPEGPLVAAWLAAAVAVTFAEAITTSHVFFQRDIHAYWYPHMVAFRRAVAEGSLPLWNPWVGFGAPFLADASFQLAYPPTWLAIVLPLAVHFKLMAIGHCLLAAWGACALARGLGLGRAGAAVAGGAYALSGPFLSSLSNLHHYPGAAWLPWVLLALHGLLRKPGLATGLRLGAVAGLQLLAGSGDLCLMTALLGGALLAGHLLRRRPSVVELASLGRPLALGTVLAVSIGAAQWLPTADRALGGLRSTQDLRTRTYWSLHPASLADLAVPRLVSGLPLAVPAREALFEGREPLYECLYLGTVTLGLAALALVLKTPGALPLVAGAFGFVLASLGRHTPLYAWLLEVPVLGLLRYPQKYLVPAAFCLSLLAAAGAERFGCEWSAAERRRARVLALLLVAVAVLLVAGASGMRATPDVLVSIVPPPDAWRAAHDAGVKMGRTAVLLAVVSLVLWRRAARASAGSRLVAALLLLGVVDLVAVARGTNPLAPAALLDRRPEVVSLLSAAPDAGRIHAAAESRACLVPGEGPAGWEKPWVAALGFADTLRPPSGVRWGLFGSYDGEFTGLGPSWSAPVTRAIDDFRGTPQGLRLLQMGGVEHVLFVGHAPPEGLERLATLASAYRCPLHLLRVPDALPRTYVVGGEKVETGDGSALRDLLDPSFDPRRDVVLPRGGGASGEGASGPAGVARLAARSLNTLDVEADLTRPGVLVVVEAFDAAWRATVDGRGSPVLRANELFRAVRLPAGRHRVRFTYEPGAARAGLGLSVAGWLAAATLAAWLAWRGRHVFEGGPAGR
jgi:hypothetical protein